MASALLQELQNAKSSLKKVTTDDKSDPLLCGFKTQKEVAEYREYIMTFDAEAWVDLLGDELTFETEQIPISFEAGKELHAVCELIETYKYRNKDWICVDVHEKLGIQLDSDLLRTLCDDIAEGMKRIGESTTPSVFAKLSCRSAKDVVTSRLDARFKESVAPEATDNEKLHLLLQLSLELLRFDSALDILKLFTLSERILGDVGAALQFPSKWQQHVILRRWYPVDIGMEFRGFVKNNTFTALSQYNYFVFFPQVVKFKEIIEEKITNLWESKCRERLASIGTYVIDFCLFGDEGVTGTEEDLRHIKVIEINPFYDTTGAALFSWKAERELLENGPFEFRITSELPKKRPEIDPEYLGILGWD